MRIKRQAQIAERAIFSLNRFNNLLIEVAPGLFAVQRQTVA